MNIKRLMYLDTAISAALMVAFAVGAPSLADAIGWKSPAGFWAFAAFWGLGAIWHGLVARNPTETSVRVMAAMDVTLAVLVLTIALTNILDLPGFAQAGLAMIGLGALAMAGLKLIALRADRSQHPQMVTNSGS